MADKNEGGAMQVDVKLVRDLAEMLNVTNLSEIEVQDGERRIRVARTISAEPTTFMPAQTLAAQRGLAAAPAAEAPAATSHAKAIQSPQVGTVDLSPEPGPDPSVAVGAQVEAGDTLLTV